MNLLNDAGLKIVDEIGEVTGAGQKIPFINNGKRSESE